MSRSPARVTERKPRAIAAGSAAAEKDRQAGLAKIELALPDGRYLVAYSRVTPADNA